MKQFLTLFAAIAIAIIVYAHTEGGQKLLVSKLQGTVLLQNGTEKVALSVGQKISSNDIVILSEGSVLTLLAPVERKQYSVSGNYVGTISKYIEDNATNCTKETTAKFMNYLLSQIYRGSSSGRKNIEDNHATVFRDGVILLDDSTCVQLQDSLLQDVILTDSVARCCDNADTLQVVRCCKMCPCGCNEKRDTVVYRQVADTICKDSVEVSVAE